MLTALACSCILTCWTSWTCLIAQLLDRCVQIDPFVLITWRSICRQRAPNLLQRFDLVWLGVADYYRLQVPMLASQLVDLSLFFESIIEFYQWNAKSATPDNRDTQRVDSQRLGEFQDLFYYFLHPRYASVGVRKVVPQRHRIDQVIGLSISMVDHNVPSGLFVIILVLILDTSQDFRAVFVQYGL